MMREISYPTGIAPNLDSDQCASRVLDLTGGAPWFVRHYVSYIGHEHARTKAETDSDEIEIETVLARASSGAREALSGDTSVLPREYCEFVLKHIDAVREEIGSGQSTDSDFVSYWTGPKNKRERGFDINSPRIEEWIGSGLVWFEGTLWDQGATDHIFRDYPTVYFQRAGELPHLLYEVLQRSHVDTAGGRS